MKNILSRLRPGAARSAPPEFTAPIMPDRPFVAVGDIHGRADLLADLGRRLEAECPDWPVVFLGDYVDRGDQSRDVLDMLMSVSETGSSPVHCLMGNHERMLLDALDDPDRAAPRWLRNGGLQVLAGFGIAPPRGPGADPGALRTMRDALENAMGAARIAWLRARPLSWRSGNVWALHAGADPHQPLDSQGDEILLWGHPAFRRSPRRDGQWVVHGHTIVEHPHTAEGRIAVDTGAYATGRLSAALIECGAVRFLQTGSDR